MKSILSDTCLKREINIVAEVRRILEEDKPNRFQELYEVCAGVEKGNYIFDYIFAHTSSREGDSWFMLEDLKDISTPGSDCLVRKLTSEPFSMLDHVPPCISRFAMLQSIDFEDVFISPSVFEDISNLQHLKYVSLFDCGLGDAGLRLMRKLKHVTYLKVGVESYITDKGCGYISEMTSITYLDLEHNNYVRYEGLRSLARLPNLKWLSLRDCDLGDRCWAFLADMPGLEFLDLSKNRITLTHTHYVESMNSLKILNIKKNSINMQDIERLKIKLPGVEIVHD